MAPGCTVALGVKVKVKVKVTRWDEQFVFTHVCKLIALYIANAYTAEREMSASACTRSVTG